MSRVLTTDDIKAIFELIEKLTPEWTDYFAADDSEGAEPPKKIPLSALKTLLVPYNGAQNDVNLGAHDITGINAFFDALHLSTTPASIPTDIGAVYWDVDAQTYSVVLPNGVTLQIGEELYVNVARDAVAPNPILDGTPVYTTGESGQRPTVDVARADTVAKIKVTGIATHDIANQGRITSFGLVRAIPLARKPSGETWVAGNYLWLAPTGGMTNVEPSSPTPNVRLGLITNVTGSASFDMLVYIRPAMGMYDLYDVHGDAPDNHSVLEWDSAVGYFKKTNEPVFIKVTVGELLSAFQKLATHTIPSTDDDILRLQNQQVGKPHSIFEIRSPDTTTTEATLSLHNVASGTNDWVFDLSMHNYSGVMKLVSVLSHFTGTDAGSWEWWSRYTNGTDYDMIERQLMKLDGQTGYLGVGESLSPEARVHVKQSGWVDKPAMMIVMDSSHDSYPEGLYVKNDTNFASGGNLVRFKLVNATDSATLLKLENAGTGAYINADGKFVVDKDGNIASPTIDAIKGTDYTEGSLKTHEDRLGTLEGTGEGSVAKAIDDAVSPLAEVVDNNRLYSDSQYLELKAKADSLQVKCNTLQAEVYTDAPILQYGATEIIGKGYEADNTPIDVSANVVDGKLSMEQKGLTITNLVNGADIANLGTVTFTTVLNDKYYDTLNNAILTGTGSDMTATNNSGATANLAIYHLNALGLSTITDTDILAKLLPYVDGTQNVGKMGVRVVGRNLFDKNDILLGGYLTVSTGTVGTGIAVRAVSGYIRVRPSTQYVVNLALGSSVFGHGFYTKEKTYISGVVSTATVAPFTTPATCEFIRLSVNPLFLDTLQLNLGSSALPYEPYQEQLTFLPAIGNSLPNGVADSIKTVADGWEKVKKVYTPEAVASGVAVNTTNYPTAKNGGQWVNELTAGGTEIGVVGTDSTTGAGMLRFELATPITTHYDLPIPTSGKTIHRFAGEEKIVLYGTGLTFNENVLSVLSAVKFVAGVMTDITDLATITTNTVTFSGVSATDVVYVKVERSVNRPLGILEHTPAVSNTASRLAALEAAVFGG